SIYSKIKGTKQRKGNPYMEIRDLQQQFVQRKAMSALTHDENEMFSRHSPLVDVTYRQLLQDKINEAVTVNRIDQTNNGNKPINYSNANTASPVHTADPRKQFTAATSEAPFDTHVAASAQKYGIDKKLIHAVIKAESNYNAKAKSGAGAQGLMQLMPATARGLGVINSFDAKQNIEGGTK